MAEDKNVGKDNIDENKESKHIYIIDVTNRDGVQTSRLGLAKLEKTIINLLLNEMGIWQSEFGFPTTHHEINYLQANLELVELGAIDRMRLGGWIRAITPDVEMSRARIPMLKIGRASCRERV